MTSAAVGARAFSRGRGERVHLTLLCFSGAGGNEPVFYDWRRQAPPWLALKSVVLPGHPGRFREKPAIDLVALASMLVEEFSDTLDYPYALFGHSMGAILAFEVARFAQRQGRPATHLFVSACAAPHLPRRVPLWDNLPDLMLQQRIAKHSTAGPNHVKTPELMELLLPIFRADVRLCETYKYKESSRLQCPIVAYAGTSDPSVTHEAIRAWCRHSSGLFNRALLPGDHHYLERHREFVIDDLCRRLATFVNLS